MQPQTEFPKQFRGQTQWQRGQQPDLTRRCMPPPPPPVRPTLRCSAPRAAQAPSLRCCCSWSGPGARQAPGFGLPRQHCEQWGTNVPERASMGLPADIVHWAGAARAPRPVNWQHGTTCGSLSVLHPCPPNYIACKALPGSPRPPSRRFALRNQGFFAALCRRFLSGPIGR